MPSSRAAARARAASRGAKPTLSPPSPARLLGITPLGAAVGLGNAQLARRRLGARGVARRNAHDLAALPGLHARNHPLDGDIRHPQHTPSNFLHDIAIVAWRRARAGA